MKRVYEESELIINENGSIFHLHIKPDELGDYILLVGDPGRVALIAGFFEETLHKSSNREFFGITGRIGKKTITALSTGIGTDNIDIVLNELDALVNIDFKTRAPLNQKRKLKLIRIGTSGAIQPDIAPGSIVASKYVIGFDGLMNFYRDGNSFCKGDLVERFLKHTDWPEAFAYPYCVDADKDLLGHFARNYLQGITISANGFYAPQGRELRAPLAYPQLYARLPGFSHNNFQITNFEMECSALYGLSRLLGHKALTVCLIIANRANKTFLGDYQRSMTKLIEEIISGIINE